MAPVPNQSAAMFTFFPTTGKSHSKSITTTTITASTTTTTYMTMDDKNEKPVTNGDATATTAEADMTSNKVDGTTACECKDGAKYNVIVEEEEEEEEEEEKSTEPSLEYPKELEDVRFSSLPYVNMNQVKIIRILECPYAGRQTKCGSGHLAEWQGQKIALKKYQPDSFHRFVREVRNYERLKPVWGELIPTPYFVSYSSGRRYLGMQLARSPEEDDDLTLWKADNGPIAQLRKRFGFRHNSPGLKHCKFLPAADEPGEQQRGRDKMIAIDLENHWWD